MVSYNLLSFLILSLPLQPQVLGVSMREKGEKKKQGYFIIQNLYVERQEMHVDLV